MPERHIGKCPKCGDQFLFEFIIEEDDDMAIMEIDTPCPECAHELEWDFLPKDRSKLKKWYRVG